MYLYIAKLSSNWLLQLQLNLGGNIFSFSLPCLVVSTTRRLNWNSFKFKILLSYIGWTRWTRPAQFFRQKFATLKLRLGTKKNAGPKKIQDQHCFWDNFQLGTKICVEPKIQDKKSWRTTFKKKKLATFSGLNFFCFGDQNFLVGPYFILPNLFWPILFCPNV